MKDCILFDFDGTITTRDTTRYLLRELLRLRPWRIFAILPHIVRLIISSDAGEVQIAKNRAISVLLRGLTPDLLLPALQRYSEAVQVLFRHRLLAIIQEHAVNGKIILVVTASPDFAIRQALASQPVEVIGTNFPFSDGQYSDDIVGVGCYGKSKADFIETWKKTSGIESRFIEAWSDAESDLPMMRLAPTRYWIPPLSQILRIREIDPDGKIFEN